MPQPLELVLRPSASNSLAWSVDGDLAVAAGDEVHLLFPRPGSQPGEDEWEHIHLEVASFSNNEWPISLTPGSAKGFFVAKEQRASEVIALQWSPTGLANHDRCTLGILTSNGLLSVYAPGERPRNATGWRRRAIINFHLEKAEVDDLKDDDRMLTVGGQVRAFAWAPRKLNTDRVFRLAVLTDDRTYVVRLTKDKMHLTPEIEAELTLPEQEEPANLQEEVERHQRGCHLLWLVNENDDVDTDSITTTGQFSRLFLACQGKIYQTPIRSDSQVDGGTLAFGTPTCLAPGYGPIVATKDLLFYNHNDRVNAIRSRPLNASAKATHYEGGSEIIGWDPISSMMNFSDGVVAAQPLSLASYSFAHNSAVQTNYLGSDEPSSLMQAVSRCRNDYGDKHDIGERVTTKMHGLAGFEDENTGKRWLAAIVSFSPNDQIEYKLRIHERATIVFSHEDLESVNKARVDGDMPFPWHAESPVIGPDVVQTEVLELISQATGHASLEARKMAILPVFLRTLLGSPTAGVQEALQVLDKFDRGAWRRVFGKKLEKRDDSNVSVTPFVNQLIRDTEKHSDLREGIEHCEIPGCGAPLFFVEGEDPLASAQCAARSHQYTRCALTLLAIQQPYISKQCERCDRTFLSRDKISEEWETARTVISSFKRCPYCGGKFMG